MSLDNTPALSDTTKEANMDLNHELTQRIDVLESTDAIREVRHRFNELLDAALESGSDHTLDQLVALLAPDFRWTSKVHGSVHGAGAFAALVKDRSTTCQMSFRILASDLHHPSDDADRSTVTWSSLGMLTIDDQQLWAAAANTDTYARIDGTWRIESIDNDYKFVCRYEEGWTDERFVEHTLLSRVM